MFDKHSKIPPTPEDISAALEVDERARLTEWEIQEAGRQAAARVPKRLFRAASKHDALMAAVYGEAVEKATRDKGLPV